MLLRHQRASSLAALALRRSIRLPEWVTDSLRLSGPLLVCDIASASRGAASSAALDASASLLMRSSPSPSSPSAPPSSGSLLLFRCSLFIPFARNMTSLKTSVSSSSSDAALADPSSFPSSPNSSSLAADDAAESASSSSSSPSSVAPSGDVSVAVGGDGDVEGGESGDDSKVGERARAIFDAAWSRLERRYGDRLRAPREQIYLMGAPGSGKGTNTVFILESRGLTRAVTMSSLLQSNPKIAAAMAAGELVPDELVADALLDTVFDPEADPAGVLVDGFPRTALQVDLLKLLHDKVAELHELHASTAAAAAAAGPSEDPSSSLDPDSAEARWPRPSFKVVVLYVDQAESVRRQMARARLAATHNARVLDAGAGQLVDVRATDVDEALCRRRYAVFKAHYATVLRLRRWFVFSLIDSGGTLEQTRNHITRELRYQSSLDLDAETWSAIRHLPLASELTRAARQQLVSSLDGHRRRHGELFSHVVDLISSEVVPLLRSSALAGFAEYTTQEPVLSNPLAQQMLIDVLTDRGFGVAHAEIEKVVPVKFDLLTGNVEVSREKKQRFRITFERGGVRNAVGSAAEAAAAPAAPAASASGSSAPARAPLPGAYSQDRTSPSLSSDPDSPSSPSPFSPFDGCGGALGSTTVVPRHLDHSQSLEDAEARWKRRAAAGGVGVVCSAPAARGELLYGRFSPERKPEKHPDDEDVERAAAAAASATPGRAD